MGGVSGQFQAPAACILWVISKGNSDFTQLWVYRLSLEHNPRLRCDSTVCASVKDKGSKVQKQYPEGSYHLHRTSSVHKNGLTQAYTIHTIIHTYNFSGMLVGPSLH
jgi:hypothetical protein